MGSSNHLKLSCWFQHFAVYDSPQPGTLYPTTTAAIDLAYWQLAPQQQQAGCGESYTAKC